eukprot:m.81759 g.81759  ORF g.81759 m.81759 type:complete len:606 (-) comp14578_c1_seq1:123-1940(-)
MASSQSLEPVNITSSYTSIGKSLALEMADVPDDVAQGNNDGFSVDAFLRNLPSFTPPSNATSGAAIVQEGSESTPELACPDGCKRYKVTERDTLQTIAVRFAMTANELLLLNRLGGSYVYPGQMLLVKDVDSKTNMPLFSDTRPSPQRSPKVKTASASLAWVQDQLSGNPKPAAKDPACSVVTMPPDYLSDTGLSAAEQLSHNKVVVHAMYVTDGEGFIPGTLKMDEHQVFFRPDDSPLIRELGAARFSFRLDLVDLLPPRSQANAPDFSTSPPPLLPAGKFHDPDGANLKRVAHIAQSGLGLPMARDNDSNNDDNGDKPDPGAAASDTPRTAAGADPGGAEGSFRPRLESSPDEDYPIYLELRLQLVFGEAPCRETVASYWLGLSRGRMEAVMDYVMAHCSDWEGEWTVIPDVPDVPATSFEQQAVAHHHMAEAAHVKVESKFLTPEMVQQVTHRLPPWQRMLEWEKLYTSYEDGISLSTLYRRAADAPGPSLLFVRDTGGGIFGAYLSDTIQISDKFYGNGKSFLFRLAPSIEFFKWTAANSYVLMGNKDSLVVGGGGGFAIWLDEGFDNGSSNPSTAFNNPCLASSEQFKIHDVEVWTFIQV